MEETKVDEKKEEEGEKDKDNRRRKGQNEKVYNK